MNIKKYTFYFEGEITVEANDVEKGYEKADDLLGTTAYQMENSVDHAIYNINLIETREV